MCEGPNARYEAYICFLFPDLYKHVISHYKSKKSITKGKGIRRTKEKKTDLDKERLHELPCRTWHAVMICIIIIDTPVHSERAGTGTSPSPNGVFEDENEGLRVGRGSVPRPSVSLRLGHTEFSC